MKGGGMSSDPIEFSPQSYTRPERNGKNRDHHIETRLMYQIEWCGWGVCRPRRPNNVGIRSRRSAKGNGGGREDTGAEVNSLISTAAI